MPNNTMTFGVDLLPNSTTSEFNLGSSDKKWNLYVDQINGTTPQFTDTTSFTITANATDGLWDLTGTNGTNAVTYAVGAYSSKHTSNARFYTGTSAPSLTTRLNYDGYFYATKLYSGGNEVLTSSSNLAWNKITGTPTTLNGYGITDGVTAVEWNATNKKITRTINSSSADIVQFVAGDNITLNAETSKLTIAATDTTYDAEKGIGLNNGKFGHSNTAITAQSASAVYPITIDDYGHITSYGSAVTEMTPTSHLHGNITNAGLLGTASVAVVTDGNKKITTEDLTVSSATDANTTATRFVYSVTQSSTGKIAVTTRIFPLTVTLQSNGFQLAGGTTSKTLTVNDNYTLGAACAKSVTDSTSNSAISTGTSLTTERDVYYGLVTVNGVSQTRAIGIYAPTSAGTAGQILTSGGDSLTPAWIDTLSVGHGGTGLSSYTVGDILVANGNTSLSTLAGNTTTTRKFLCSVAATAGTAAVPTWNTLTKTDVGLENVENTALSTWAGTSNITTIGTITNTIKSTSGFELTLSDINANLANNNISGEDDVYGNYLIRDVNNKDLSCFRSAIRPNGDIYTQLYACNYNTTDNTPICTPRIDLIAYKTGLGYFTIAIPHTVLTLYTDSPTATRSYLKLHTDIDGHIDIRFARQGVEKWSISSRNSAENKFGIFNHTTNQWSLTISSTDDTITLKTALPIASGGTGATSAQNARVNLGAFPRIANVSTASALNIRKNSITYSDGADDGGSTKFYGALLTMTQNTNESDSSRVSQLFIQSSSANADMKVRTYSGQWNEWKTVYTSATTVPVSNGGTGATSFTANSVIMSGNSTTAALTTRAITNNTSATAVTASTNLITANTLYYHKGNSNITTVGTITSGTWNGTAIAAAYIGNHSTDKLTSGTLPLGRGGTNATTAAAALLSIGAVQRNIAWNTCANGIAHYCYEGSNSSTYDLPIDNVHLLRLGYNATRGVTIAAKWSSGEYGLWINRMHDTWKGWQPLSNTYYAAASTEKVIGYWGATSKPIYRYVIINNSVTGTGTQTVGTLPRTPDTIINVYGSYLNADGNLHRVIPFYNSTAYFVGVGVTSGKVVQCTFGSSMNDTKKVRLVVEYTAS